MFSATLSEAYDAVTLSELPRGSETARAISENLYDSIVKHPDDIAEKIRALSTISEDIPTTFRRHLVPVALERSATCPHYRAVVDAVRALPLPRVRVDYESDDENSVFFTASVRIRAR